MGKDARFFYPMMCRVCLLGVILFILLTARMAVGQVQYETANFTICNAPTQERAVQYGEAAEKFRKELAMLWLGKTLPDWSGKCSIKVHVDQQLGAGGATTFVFEDGEVFDWEMEIQGSSQRILDSVLPHEITHTILATHFRKPIPRWLDEGAATSVENDAEKNNYRRLLHRFIRSDVHQCLPMNKMVSLTEYPDDPMPFYAQGFSIVEYLLSLGRAIDSQEHQRLTHFIGSVMNGANWQSALQEHYKIDSLGDLQTNWVQWVAQQNPVENVLESRLENPVAAKPITLVQAAFVQATPRTSLAAKVAEPYDKSVYDRDVVPIPVKYSNEALKPIPSSYSRAAVIR
jgi:hypothetical protein